MSLFKRYVCLLGLFCMPVMVGDAVAMMLQKPPQPRSTNGSQHSLFLNNPRTNSHSFFPRNSSAYMNTEDESDDGSVDFDNSSLTSGSLIRHNALTAPGGSSRGNLDAVAMEGNRAPPPFTNGSQHSLFPNNSSAYMNFEDESDDEGDFSDYKNNNNKRDDDSVDFIRLDFSDDEDSNNGSVNSDNSSRSNDSFDGRKNNSRKTVSFNLDENTEQFIENKEEIQNPHELWYSADDQEVMAQHNGALGSAYEAVLENHEDRKELIQKGKPWTDNQVAQHSQAITGILADTKKIDMTKHATAEQKAAIIKAVIATEIYEDGNNISVNNKQYNRISQKKDDVEGETKQHYEILEAASWIASYKIKGLQNDLTKEEYDTLLTLAGITKAQFDQWYDEVVREHQRRNR